jgi:hypothetical protein
MRAVALLGHGSAIGIESPYLQTLAGALPSRGITGGRSAGAQVACRTAAGASGNPSANHTFGTRTGVPYSAAMTLITTAATE